MASGEAKSASFFLLFVNLILYFTIAAIAGSAFNQAMDKTHKSASVLQIPARIFPVYFPFGNMATGFFVFFSFIAGVVGFVTSLTGISNVIQWDAPNLYTAVSSSFMTWSLTLLAMGFACKEINIGWTDSKLRTLETIVIILSGTQLFCLGAIQAGVQDAVHHGY